MTFNTDGTDPYIQSLAASRSRPAVIKIQFLNFRSQHPQGVIIAVEGDDDKTVYSYWIRRVNSSLSYEFFVCGGKRGVRKLKNCLFEDKSNAKEGVYFIVDRDYDDMVGFLCDQDVFMLDRYSIENYLIERNILNETIKVAFPGNGKPGVRASLCDIFDADFSAFLSASAELNKRIFIARRMGINIDHVMPESISKIASISIGNIVKSNVPAHDTLPFDKEVDEASFLKLSDEFSSLHPSHRYRGKYSFKFLKTWLSLLIESYKRRDLDVFKNDDAEQGKIKSDEMSLGALSCRSPLPDKFPNFIARVSDYSFSCG